MLDAAGTPSWPATGTSTRPTVSTYGLVEPDESCAPAGWRVSIRRPGSTGTKRPAAAVPGVVENHPRTSTTTSVAIAACNTNRPSASSVTTEALATSSPGTTTLTTDVGG